MTEGQTCDVTLCCAAKLEQSEGSFGHSLLQVCLCSSRNLPLPWTAHLPWPWSCSVGRCGMPQLAGWALCGVGTWCSRAQAQGRVAAAVCSSQAGGVLSVQDFGGQCHGGAHSQLSPVCWGLSGCTGGQSPSKPELVCWLEKHWLILCVLELWLGNGKCRGQPSLSCCHSQPRLSVVPETLAPCRVFCLDGLYPPRASFGRSWGVT